MVLHCLAVPPSHPALADCLATAGPEDTILLLGDGVYNALPGSEACAALQNHKAAVVVLAQDAAAMGVATDPSAFAQIDMPGFVQLTETYPRQLAWY